MNQKRPQNSYIQAGDRLLQSIHWMSLLYFIKSLLIVILKATTDKEKELMSNSGEITQPSTPPQKQPDPSHPSPKFSTEQAKKASDEFEAIKEALIGPKPPDEKGQKTWVLPKEDPKTKFSTPYSTIDYCEELNNV